MSIHHTVPRSEMLTARFDEVRRHTTDLIESLNAEDCQLQSMPDASPVKWHLAHTTWFFETFVLASLADAPAAYDPAFKVLFNSYYVGVGERHTRAERGMLSRPTLKEVLDYRAHVDQHLRSAMQNQGLPGAVLDLIELGLNHEQQHQELILTDLKHHFFANPLRPAWRPISADQSAQSEQGTGNGFILLSGGLIENGYDASGFCYDNELPRHRVWLAPFELATHNVTNGDYLAFMADGGYNRPELWLSDGWDLLCQEQWRAPLYWRHDDEGWHNFTLHGEQPLAHDAALSHVSFYEADAYARWANARLPTEAEWEFAARSEPQLSGLFNEVWQWTNSAYLAYPGYQPAPGAVGEYNGKFMINQMVLRGASLATPTGHSRTSYRNFFPPQARWQFSGLRLAREPC
ncbi:MAG TPA: ergothioneine biosynthesis protein EgtB [Pseudomonas xinjiangensis]|uniref:Ergothioneine biosynthesis protein EgtB n=2 Tax=root TaxID=1 RepID=A0A7V1BMM2_9GAMM|nr:ergothioneine biosynthesis protein EgtB [Halopseudomonas xinjiangensis]HEC49161.1 ergothioneine biosynthesis protein EgtB [Halopseudomonas xinjiangensis]